MFIVEWNGVVCYHCAINVALLNVIHEPMEEVVKSDAQVNTNTI